MAAKRVRGPILPPPSPASGPPQPHRSLARLTPSCSTGSVASRSPAVSLSTSGYPPTFRATSTTSRVVPATGDTMAAGLWPGGAGDNTTAAQGTMPGTPVPSRHGGQRLPQDLRAPLTQQVEQAALAHVGGAGDDGVDPPAEQLPTAPVLQVGTDLLLQRPHGGIDCGERAGGRG